MLWTVVLILGALFWLESIGVGHPVYRIGLMVGAFSWFEYAQ